MNWRLLMMILLTLVDDIAIFVVILLVPPIFGVKVPLPIIIGIALAWTLFSVYKYIATKNVITKKPMGGFTDMIGLEGMVTEDLNPKGTVKIKGETWLAEAAEGQISRGEKVIVERQAGMVLIVRKLYNHP